MPASIAIHYTTLHYAFFFFFFFRVVFKKKGHVSRPPPPAGLPKLGVASLRGKPVIVGGGVVLSASYEARARGVRTAMGGRRARALCPDAIVARMSAYSEASRAVFAVFDESSPLVEAMSIDEAFLDGRGLAHIRGTPRQMAARLRAEVRERCGLPLTVGVARTKFLAKVASGVAKPDGLLVVPPDRELACLHPLPVERLWGVGAVTASKLRRRRDPHGRRRRGATEGRAGGDARRGPGSPAPCALPQPRSAPRPAAPAPALDRVAVRDRHPVPDADRDRRHPARPARRARHGPDAEGGPGRPHGHAAAAVPRLRRHAVADRTRPTAETRSWRWCAT